MCQHSLCVSIMPLSSDRVLLKECRDPLLTLGLPLAGRLPLHLLQDEFLIGGFSLVLVVDGSGHVLPQSERQKQAVMEKQDRSHYVEFCLHPVVVT